LRSFVCCSGGIKLADIIFFKKKREREREMDMNEWLYFPVKAEVLSSFVDSSTGRSLMREVVGLGSLTLDVDVLSKGETGSWDERVVR